MRKKVLFMMINMNVGGMEKALLNMISVMPKDQYEITVLMLEEYGGFLDHLPKEIKKEYLQGYENIKDLINDPPQLSALKYLKKGRLIQASVILGLHIITKILDNRELYIKYVLRKYPRLEQEYDVAIAYAGPNDLISYFVYNKINAKEKKQWIHFDVTKIGFNSKFSLNLYKKYNEIFVVSEEAKYKLTRVLPQIKEKTRVFQNIVSPHVIYHHAKNGKGFKDNFSGIRILTVGRLAIEKGQDLAIKALARLIAEGFNVRWYCVGDGFSRVELESMIEEYNLKDHFILLGSDPNPYPYIDQCDIYVQPSRYEGYCITLIEARCLHKPIVTTDVNGSREQIIHGENGLIVGINEEEIFRAIKLIVMDGDLGEKFSSNLAEEDFNSEIVLEDII